MPSFDLFSYFQSSLTLDRSWWLNGKHYGRTCEDWLLAQDAHKNAWIGSGREVELVTSSKRGEMDEAEKRSEGRKTFFRWEDTGSSHGLRMG